MRVRKRPREVQAELYDGTFEEAKRFAQDDRIYWMYDGDSHLLKIDTLEGSFTVRPGDFVITGVAGEKYPCKPDIFWETYEVVE